MLISTAYHYHILPAAPFLNNQIKYIQEPINNSLSTSVLTSNSNNTMTTSITTATTKTPRDSLRAAASNKYPLKASNTMSPRDTDKKASCSPPTPNKPPPSPSLPCPPPPPPGKSSNNAIIPTGNQP